MHVALLLTVCCVSGRQSAALSSPTQHSMPLCLQNEEESGELKLFIRNGVYYYTVGYILNVQSNNDFQYISGDFRSDTCEMCYSYECVNINEARCEYYREVANIMEEDEFEREESEITNEVDDMLWEYVDTASSASSFQYCIPLVSQYTNCHKDNICSGCKICNCDVSGTWNCTTIENCHTSSSIVIDHRVLVKTMENLNLLKTNNLHRMKRSTDFNNDDINNYKRTLNWLYGIDSLEESSVEIIRNVSSIEQENPASLNRTDNISTTHSHDTINNLNKMKPLIILKNDNITKYNRTLQWWYGTDSMGKKSIENERNMAKLGSLNIAANMIADHNEVQNNNSNKTKKWTSFDINKYIRILKWLYGIDSLDEKFDENRRNLTNLAIKQANINITHIQDNNSSILKHLEKRSVVLITNESRSTTLNVNTSDKNQKQNQYNNILEPLNNIISDKETEINQLIHIKKKLMKYLKLDTNITDSNHTKKMYENKGNYSFNFYQIELPPEIDFRRRNINILDKYVKKLKKDIHEVMRDIAIIQKMSQSPMSQELKILIRAMRKFTQKDKIHKRIGKHEKIENFRRKFNSVYHDNLNDIEAVKNILELLDKDTPIGDALAPLSQTSRKILERIINFIYIEDSFNSFSRILDPNNEIENYIINIGNKWNKMTLNIGTNIISERLYSLKLFVLELFKDILKISKAIESLEYAQNRRTTIINDFVIERLVSKIGADFKKINNRVVQIIQFQLLNQNKNEKLRKDSKSNNTKKSAKKSFIQQIKKLLRNTKTDITDIFKKVPEPRNIKKIKKTEMKKQNLAKYEETMRKWQKNLGASRSKRNTNLNNFTNRIKNIIPGYLRGKVKHGVDKKNNKTKTLKDLKHKGHKYKKMSATDV